MDQLAHLIIIFLVTVITVSVAQTHHDNDGNDSNHQMADSVLLDQVNVMKDEINALKAANMKAMDGFVKLLAQVDLLKTKNIALTTANTNIIKQMDAMKAEVNALKAENYELRADYTKVMNQMGAVKAEMTSMVGHVNSNSTVSFQKSKSEGDVNIDKSGRVQNNFVAFTAYPSATRDCPVGQKIQFDGTIRNYGGYYDPNESQFTCPVTAYYLFSVSARSTGGDNFIHALIQIDGEGLTMAVGYDSGSEDQGSTTVVTLCEAGQVVAVYVGCCDSTNHMAGGSVSSFTGVLLQIA